MTTVLLGTVVEEALRAMLREVVREVVREEVRAALAECQVARAPQVETPAASLLTVREVAADLRVTEPTVREWIKAGDLVARRLGGRGQRRLLRVTREALEDFKRRRTTSDDDGAGSIDDLAKDIVSKARAKRSGR